MPNGPMDRFLTRRSVAVLTGSLAFAVIYWYIRRQQSLKCGSRNRKANAKLYGQKSFDVLKESKSNSKENIASVVKSNDDVEDLKLSDNVGNAGLDCNQFGRKFSDDVLVAELDNNMIDANDISVLEVPNNSLPESKGGPIDNFPRSYKILVANEEETLNSSSIWIESEAEVGNICITRKCENAIGKQSSDPNIIEYRSLNTPSSEV